MIIFRILLLATQWNYGILLFQIRASRKESIAKSNFSQKSFFIIFGVEIYSFLEGFGAVFLVYCVWKTDLNIDGFWCGHGSRDVDVQRVNNTPFWASKNIKADRMIVKSITYTC